MSTTPAPAHQREMFGIGDGSFYTDFADLASRTGLDWDVQLVPVPMPVNMPEWMRVSMTGQPVSDHTMKETWLRANPNPNKNMVLRDDTWTELAIKPKTYHPFTNESFGELVDMIVREYACEYSALSVLRGGRVVTATLKFLDPWRVPGDDSMTYSFVNISNGHDGSKGLTVAPGSFRYNCSNIERVLAAEARKHGYAVSKKHTRQITRIDEIYAAVRGLMDASAVDLKRYRETATKVAESMPISRGQFLGTLFPVMENDSKIRVDHMMKKRETVEDILMSPTITNPLNPWSLHQAVVEADEHVFTRHGEQRRKEVHLNGGTNLSADSFKLIQQMTGV